MDFSMGASDVMPNRETLQALLLIDDPSPVVMLNLLKLKPGGEAEFKQYLRMTAQLREEYGLSSSYSGAIAGNVIGDSDWDIVALVRYPSRKILAEILLSDTYAAAAPHRVAALARAELIVTTELG